MSWDRSILSDSGGFQVFSLSELRKISEEGVAFRSHLDGSSHVFTPEKSMEIQIALGADIIMAFDECTEHPADRSRAKQSMDLTAALGWPPQRYFDEHRQEVPWAEDVSRSKFHVSRSSNDGSNAKRATRNVETTQSLFAIVQGGMYPDLRRECAERLVGMNFPGYAIGGLSVGEPRALTYETVQAVEPHLPRKSLAI